MTLPKSTRNRKLILLRISNPKKWSFSKLATKFNVSKAVAHELWNMHKDKYVKTRTNSKDIRKTS